VEVIVLDRQRAVRVNRRALRAFAGQLVRSVPGSPADLLGVCLVSDRAMRDYNRRYRGKDGTTDVLAFPAGGDAEPDGTRPLGEIVIAPRTAAAQARRAGHSLARELRLLLLHGYLHLLGHDHETDGGVMRRLERSLVRRLLPARRAGRR